MSVTIADLKYQNTEVALHRYMRDTYSWLFGFRIIDGVQGKTTMNSIGITGVLLNAADCVVEGIDTALASKEIDLDYYNLSFPIALCDLKETWLSGFANKYRDEKQDKKFKFSHSMSVIINFVQMILLVLLLI